MRKPRAPLLVFVAICTWYVDMSQAVPLATPPTPRALGEAALLLLFAYAGFENLPRLPANSATRVATCRSRCC